MLFGHYVAFGMKISLLFVGKTTQPYLKEGIDEYTQRVSLFIGFEIVTLQVPKKWNSLAPEQRKEKEGQLIIEQMNRHDYCILLDEHGKKFDSKAFAKFLQERMNRSTKSLLFIIGGPWGFSQEVKKSANMLLSLSSMTFSHQLIRLIFMEQLYRAYAIINNQPYHNE